MPRSAASGAVREAQRLNVLACVRQNPNLGARAVGRALEVPESTVRNILKRWTVADFEQGSVNVAKSPGRPCLKGKRWKRCDISVVLTENAFISLGIPAGIWPGYAKPIPSMGAAGWPKK